MTTAERTKHDLPFGRDLWLAATPDEWERFKPILDGMIRTYGRTWAEETFYTLIMDENINIIPAVILRLREQTEPILAFSEQALSNIRASRDQLIAKWGEEDGLDLYHDYLRKTRDRARELWLNFEKADADGWLRLLFSNQQSFQLRKRAKATKTIALKSINGDVSLLAQEQNRPPEPTPPVVESQGPVRDRRADVAALLGRD